MSATFIEDAPAADWGLIVDGTTFSEFGVQNNGSDILIAVATAKPAANSQAAVLLSAGRTESLTMTIAAADKVYAKGFRNSGSVRGYKVSRA